ncbi:hypothetical protein V494_05585 [Pseudogymnoascus sp. VKM F-4513 (FW-928)]|nr:hypothetical protein V494_05585 [Pseudogymnoascus sp. VKM F-4513 (FW-928)]
MSDDSDRNLRREIKKLRISFKRPGCDERPGCDARPSEHSETFNFIRAIRNKNLDDYGKDMVFKSNEPWRKQTHDRAKWLARRASSLVDQRRSEGGWRSNIENDVFHRFRVEVACPTCRARIWKSEIEAYNDLPYDEAVKLEERRTRRESCSCPLEHRPTDSYYDVGVNPLFDDRAEEFILHGPLMETKLPKKKPDRIFGLKKTRAFAKILDADGRDYEDVPRCSPFKNCIDPLLFPFLIIEAKPEKSSVGFEETQTQSALPIWELLRLQEGIRAEQSTESQSASPLVWFFAYRGESWRVYGCYVTRNEPKQYEIVQLWDGCITDEDKSLQLLLIIDYVADWARDIYRPSILKHLKSTVSQIAYDQVSLSNDSDVYSLKRQISNWIPAPPTLVEANEMYESIPSDQGPISHRSILPVPIPNTERGSLRSAALFESRIFGLRLTEDNVKYLLRFSMGVDKNPDKSETLARDILKLFSESDCIAIPETDLDFLEDSWTGDINSKTRASTSNSATFYTLVEFSTFMTNTWNIAKEISYLAVSKPALNALVAAADYTKPLLGIDSIEQRARPCTHTVWRDAIECLRLGSPRQHFYGAISCTRVSLCSLPVRKRLDNTPDTEALGFTRISQIWLRRIIDICHRYSRKQTRRDPFGVPIQTLKPKPRQLTFICNSERIQVTSSGQAHNIQICKRCEYVGKESREDHRFSPIDDEPAIPEYGMVLVETLDLTASPPTKHDLCLIAFDIIAEISNNSALSVVIEDLLQTGKIFQTIRHPLPPSYANELQIRDTIWNLPLPYRPVTIKQKYDAWKWSFELQEKKIPILKCTERQMNHWDDLQLLLHFLSQGLPWEDSRDKVKSLAKESCCRSSFYRRLDLIAKNLS